MSVNSQITKIIGLLRALAGSPGCLRARRG